MNVLESVGKEDQILGCTRETPRKEEENICGFGKGI